MQEVASLVSTLGFPIAMTLLMWRFVTSTLDKMQESLGELSQSVEENTRAIRELRRDLHNKGNE